MKNFARLSAVFLMANLALASSANAECGVADVVKGDVKVKGSGGETALAVGGKVCTGDQVTTGKDSRAKIKMPGEGPGKENFLNINPESAIKIEAYENNPEAGKKKVLLNVMYGKMRATVNTKYDGKSADGQPQLFQVKTKSAVAGVRGTDFLTGYQPKGNQMQVVTFHGRVEVGQPGPGGALTNSVSVGAGQTTSAVAGQAPSAPKEVPKSELQQMNQSTEASTASDSKSTAGSDNGKGDKDKDKDKEDKKDSDKKDDGDKKEDKKEDKKDGDKKEDKKSEDKKSEDKKEDKKSEDKKSEDKKADDKKSDDKKSEDKKESKREEKRDDNKPADKNDGDKKAEKGGEGPKGDRQPASDKPGEQKTDGGGGTGGPNPKDGGPGGGPITKDGGPGPDQPGPGPRPGPGGPVLILDQPKPPDLSECKTCMQLVLPPTPPPIPSTPPPPPTPPPNVGPSKVNVQICVNGVCK